jgi:hypothetical protein
MSQVAVNGDNLKLKRKKTLAQERKINRTGDFKKWQMSDATKTLMIERIIAVAFVPIAFFWSLILSFLGIGLTMCLILFKILSKIWRIFRNSN